MDSCLFQNLITFAQLFMNQKVRENSRVINAFSNLYIYDLLCWCYDEVFRHPRTKFLRQVS